MQQYNIKSEMEYCCIVWSPVNQKWIYELEKIQKNFTKKIKVMEELNYHERLKKINMYSLERRRERYMITYGWQQLEGIKENVLRLVASDTRRDRRIISPKIRDYANGKRLTRVVKETNLQLPIKESTTSLQLHPWMDQKSEKKENCSVDKFKRHLDDWLKTV